MGEINCNMYKKIFIAFLSIILFLGFIGFGYKYIVQDDKLNDSIKLYKTETTEESTQNKPSPTPTTDNIASISNADRILESMSLDKKIYQMFFVVPESITMVNPTTEAGEITKNALAKYPVGGIIYFSKNLKNKKQTSQMINNSQSFSEIPLFIGVDEEGGRVARLGNNPDMGTTKLPAMKQIGQSGDYQKAYEVGQTLGEDLSGLGFNVDFAPDADVLINENNTEIGDRSFGNDPYLVSNMVRGVVMGLQEFNVSAAIKHFPGHGSTSTNSHTGYSESTRTLEDLRKCEFLPFKSGIEAGADFVLISHMTLVNAIEEKVPSSLSHEVISGYLFDEIGFKGIAITDSFSMGAITENYSIEEASVKTILAGADMILMPSDIDRTFKAIKNAVLNGKISEERINTSVRKILNIKDKMNLLY